MKVPNEQRIHQGLERKREMLQGGHKGFNLYQKKNKFSITSSLKLILGNEEWT